MSRAHTGTPRVHLAQLNIARMIAPTDDPRAFALDRQSATDDAATLLVASLAGRPVACGSVRRTTDTIGEITRVHVVPDARGDKIGAAVLDRLEAVAVRLGLTALAVEIGVRQHAAIGLHRNAGYARTESWRLESRAAGLAHRKTLTPSD